VVIVLVDDALYAATLDVGDTLDAAIKGHPFSVNAAEGVRPTVNVVEVGTLVT
jgi:hypothetical protein